MFTNKIEYVIQRSLGDGIWSDCHLETHEYKSHASLSMKRLQENNRIESFRLVKRVHFIDNEVVEHSKNNAAPTVVISTKSTVTTVTVNNNLYHVYSYDNGTYNDLVVRDSKGWLVQPTSERDLYNSIISKYNEDK